MYMRPLRAQFRQKVKYAAKKNIQHPTEFIWIVKNEMSDIYNLIKSTVFRINLTTILYHADRPQLPS